MERALDQIDFERPPFVVPGRLEAESYVQPSPSFGGVSAGFYRNAGSPIEISDEWDPVPVYQIPVLLRGTPSHNAWRDGRHVVLPSLSAGTVTCFDMRDQWRVELWYPFESLHFYIPQQAFDEFTDELRQPRIGSLTCSPTDQVVDPTIHHLALALASLMDRPSAPPSLLTDQILSSVQIHLACTYGGIAPPVKATGRLSEQQIGLVRGLLLDDLQRDVRLSDLASACNLSLSEFRRSFKGAFGRPPHQWRLAQKVERAHRLLDRTNCSLAEIAALCGFADQSHLTRSFARMIGVPPGAYRRARRS
ncbi:AraC family transcriptional regulator [Sphingosinicellaceae bacterium]|nr:AraC family transcriptional regulator [Sphingosinicellaceae bacterium]